MGRSPTSTKNYQTRWRIAGFLAIAVAALLAAGSVATGILRDTVIHIARLFARELPADLAPNASVALCAVYWGAFSLSLLVALYLALLDFRYIRLQYALEKQRLFQQSLGEGLSRATLRNDPDN